MPPIRRLFACAALGSSLLLSSCTGSEAPPLRVGINPWPTYDLLWVADQKGYFRELGLDVRLEQFPGVSDSLLALEQGRIDAAGLTTAEIAHSHLDLKPLYVLNQSIGLDALVGGPGIRTLADLAGSRVGIEPESVGGLLLEAALDSVGLALQNVDVVPMSQATGEDMIHGSLIDAIVTYPPILTRLEQQEGFTRLFDSAQVPGLVYDFLAAPAEIAKARPRDVALLIAGYERALQLLHENPAEVHAMIARRHRLDPDEAAGWFTTGMQVYGAADQAQLLRAGGPVDESIRRARGAIGQFAADGR